LIDMNCPHCGHALKIPVQYAGQKGVCKYCHKEITVPAGDAPAAAPSVGIPGVPPPAAPAWAPAQPPPGPAAPAWAPAQPPPGPAAPAWAPAQPPPGPAAPAWAPAQPSPTGTAIPSLDAPPPAPSTGAPPPPGAAYGPPPPGGAIGAPGFARTMDTDYPTGWNWGAFFLGWIWALGHGLWLWAVLGFCLNACWWVNIYLGIQGNQLALENYSGTASQYRQQEKIWAIVGLVLTCLVIFGYAIIAAVGAFAGSSPSFSP